MDRANRMTLMGKFYCQGDCFVDESLGPLEAPSGVSLKLWVASSRGGRLREQTNGKRKMLKLVGVGADGPGIVRRKVSISGFGGEVDE